MIRPFYRALKITGSPTQYRLRKRLAGEIVAIAKPRMTTPDRAGSRLFGPDDIEGTDCIVRYCGTVYQQSREDFPPEYFQKYPHKKFLFPILEDAEFCRHPELLRFMVSRPTS